MALFKGSKKIDGSRSNTHLVKSGHQSPAEDWLLDPYFNSSDLETAWTGGELFYYEYGGIGQQSVVIPKGRMVGVTAPAKDNVSRKFKTVLTLPGLASKVVGNKGNCIGMVPYNVCKDETQNDGFGGNKPAIITQDYVELPYIPQARPSNDFSAAGVLEEELAITVGMKNPWGAVIGAGLAPGDYVKYTPSGRLTKFDPETDNQIQKVGQVLAMDINQESIGWLKWVMYDLAFRNEDDVFLNRLTSTLPTEYGYPYEPQYRNGNTIFQQYQSKFLTNPTGMHGLHDGTGNYDGFGRNDMQFTAVAMGTTPVITDPIGHMTIQAVDTMGNPLKNLQQEDVKVYVDGVEVEANKIKSIKIDGKITFEYPLADGDKAVTADYKANFFGSPTFLDFIGVVGSVSILLSK
jgi:hypothetical protein